MLTYYRTSRSLHFPFGAACSLSGAQPEMWSVSWKPPVHRTAFPLFFASLQSTSFVVSPAGGRGGPGLLWPGPLGSNTAQDQSPARADVYLSCSILLRSKVHKAPAPVGGIDFKFSCMLWRFLIRTWALSFQDPHHGYDIRNSAFRRVRILFTSHDRAHNRCHIVGPCQWTPSLP